MSTRQSAAAILSAPAIVGVAVVARLALFVAGPMQDPARTLINADSERYVVLADNLITYRRFARAKEDGIVHLAIERVRAATGTLPPPDDLGLRAEGFRSPGYPAYLAAFRILTPDLRLPILVQCLLSAAMAGAVFAIARAFGGTGRAASLAALGWALHPGLLVYDNGVMGESTFNILTVSAVFAATRAETWRGMAVAGALLGLAGLVRPLGLFYLPFVLLVAAPRRSSRWAAATVAVAVAVAPSAAWAMRNHNAGFGFRVSTVGDVNHLFYTAASMRSESKREDWLARWPVRVAEYESELLARAVPGRDVFTEIRSLAFDEFRAEPALVARVLAKSWMKLFVDHSQGVLATLRGREYVPTGLFSSVVLRQPGSGGSAPVTTLVGTLAWVLLNVAIAGLAVLGTWRWVSARHWPAAAAVVVTIGLFTMATSAVGLERMRLPMMLPLLLAAAATFEPRRP